MSERPMPIADALEQAAARMNERIRTAHERVACPTCGSPTGSRCRLVQRPWKLAGPAPAGRPPGRDLKHSHKDRLRADGINLR